MNVLLAAYISADLECYFYFSGMIVSFTYYKYVTAVFSVSSISPVSYVILTVIKYSILLIPPLNFSLTVEKLLMTWRVNHMVEALAQHGLDEKEFGVDSEYLINFQF